jgi:hypothetical protein
MRRVFFGILVVMLAFAINIAIHTPAEAQMKRLVGGVEANRRVEKLTSDIQWEKSLERAKHRARSEGKLIFWVHMRGTLEGKT